MEFLKSFQKSNDVDKMTKNVFENIINEYLDDFEQLINNYDPYDDILDSYGFLKVIGEVD